MNLREKNCCQPFEKLVIFDGNLLGGYQRENEKLKILAAVFSKCSNSENKFLFRFSAP